MYIFDYLKINSVLKMNLFFNIDPYPIPVINIKNSYLQYFSRKLRPYHFSEFINPIFLYLNPYVITHPKLNYKKVTKKDKKLSKYLW